MVADRHKPTYVQFSKSPEYASCKELFEEKGWIGFLQKFRGYNDIVTLAFSQSFYGQDVYIGNFKFKFAEESISNMIVLLISGEKFFKRGSLDPTDCAKFLKPAYKSLNWSRGVLRSCLEERWYPLVTTLQRFIMREDLDRIWTGNKGSGIPMDNTSRNLFEDLPFYT